MFPQMGGWAALPGEGSWQWRLMDKQGTDLRPPINTNKSHTEHTMLCYCIYNETVEPKRQIPDKVRVKMGLFMDRVKRVSQHTTTSAVSQSAISTSLYMHTSSLVQPKRNSSLPPLQQP